jgi:telomerase protein component 1
VALKGNKASTWETLLGKFSHDRNTSPIHECLIDHKKLPFMAMLRNLRNMIKAGISSKHHNLVLRKLADEVHTHQFYFSPFSKLNCFFPQGAVINSKQFPFRFFSAYEVLDELQKEYEINCM